MKPVRRKFNRALYEAYDQKARDALIAHLKNRGHTILTDKEDYNVDVVSLKGDNIYYNEAEVKVAWSGEWPSHWAEIRIPERKTRLLDKYKTGLLNFYIFDKDLEQVFRIKDTCLTPDRLKVAFGRNIPKGEQFYHIPYKDAELISLQPS